MTYHEFMEIPSEEWDKQDNYNRGKMTWDAALEMAASVAETYKSAGAFCSPDGIKIAAAIREKIK